MKNIFIVDDIKVNLKILEVLLTRNGYNTISALSGKIALGLLQTKSVDLIISDILMPEMDGFQFCRLCKLDENLKHIPFVFYSSIQSEAEARKLARKVGAQAFITKPADPAMLLKTIDDIFFEYDPAPLARQENGGTKPHSSSIERPENRRESHNADLAEQSYNTLLRNLPCVIWTIDSSGRITNINPIVKEITGFSMDSIRKMGKQGWLERVHPSDIERVRTGYQNLFRNDIALDIEYAFECQDGCFIWLHEKSGIPYKKNGQLHADGISFDDSEKKYNQARHLKSRETETVKTFAGGLAHDLNNLFTGIAGYIELSTMPSISPSERERFLSNALKISRNASDLTQDFLAVSSDPKPAKKDTLFKDVVSRVTNSLFNGSDIEYKLEIPLDLWSCRVDTQQMSKAFKNIIINAKEAVVQDGFIEVILQNVFIEKKQICSSTVVDPGYYIKATIRDNGRGIDKEKLHQIFYPYYSTKPQDIKKGVGLSLTLSEAIITLHGGVIAVSSLKESGGTTVDIYLPALKPEENAIGGTEQMPLQDIVADEETEFWKENDKIWKTQYEE